MKNEPLVVKTQSGAVWGKVHRLIIDPANRQIAYVDVILADMKRHVRLPWKSLEVVNDHFVLTKNEAEGMEWSYGEPVSDMVTLVDSSSLCQVTTMHNASV